MAQESPDWQALAAEVEGQVLPPDAPGYETARRPALARFRDARPAAVVRCAVPADVAATIAFARAAGLPVAARSGGHCLAGHSSTDGVVADVGPMAEVTVADGVATVGAGARLGAVYDALAAEGLTIPAGCGPRVGTAGLVLGGGLGILGRMRGVLADSLVGADVVLADGRLVACDEDHEPDLFWALRGAGAGGFGIVTALRFATLPAPATTRLLCRWPARLAGAVLAAWQGWAPVAPDPLAASLLVAAPADPRLAPVITVAGAYAGPRTEAAAQLDDLVARVGSAPGEALLEHASYRETKRELSNDGAEDPLEREHIAHRSQFFAAPIPPDAAAALLAHLEADRRPGEGRELDFGPLGGAYARVPADATAFVHRDARLPAQGLGRRGRRGGRGREGGGAGLGRPRARDRRPARHRRGVPELPRARPGGLGAGLPRREPRPPRRDPRALRPRGRAARPADDPAPGDIGRMIG